MIWKLTKDELENLKSHKYTSVEYTTLDNILNYYWFFVVNHIPKTISPNILSIIGFLFSISLYPFLIYYGIEREEIPWYIYAYFAFGMFMYQTFDAIDGKQARRLKYDNPLGMLIDHGFDSFTMTIEGSLIVYVLNFHSQFMYCFAIFMTYLSFYYAMWEDMHIHITRIGICNFGVTGFQVLIMVSSILTLIFGNTIWEFNLLKICPDSLGNFIGLDIIKPKWFLLALVITIPFMYFFASTYAVFKKTQFRFRCFTTLIPLYILAFEFYLVYIVPFTKTHLITVIPIIALIFGLLIHKILICSSTKRHFNAFHLEFIYPLIYYFGNLWIKYNALTKSSQDFYEWSIFTCVIVGLLIHTVVFIGNIYYQISKYLDLPIIGMKLIKKD